jgi:GH15 family glucan-1,4-alpha-glucosidase
MIALVGFLPPDDARVAGTVDAIQRDLLEDGFVLRCRTDHTDDGLPGRDGSFLPHVGLVNSAAKLGRPSQATRRAA